MYMNACMHVHAPVRASACAHAPVYVLRIVSMDKILHFTNTLLLLKDLTQ